MTGRLLSLITERAPWVLLAVTLVTALALSALVDFRTGEVRLRLDPAASALFPEDDEETVFYEWVRRAFGSDETLIVAVQPPGGVFRSENLLRLAEVTRALEDVDGVRSVVSLANALNIRPEDGDLLIEPFLEVIPETPAQVERLRAEVLANPIASKNLISTDGLTAAVVVTLMDWPESRIVDEGVDLAVLEVARIHAGEGSKVLLSGAPHVKAVTSRVLLADMKRMGPLLIGLVLLVSFLFFRTVSATWIPLLTVIAALVWTLAGVVASGHSLNLVTVVVPPLILVIGFAYAIHVIAAYYEEARSNPSLSKQEAVRAALGVVALPTLLTGATTAAGFLSLTTSPLGAIQQFGMFSMIGVLSAMLAALLLVPPILCLLPRPSAPRETDSNSRIDSLMTSVATFDIRNRRAILVGGALVGLVSVAAIGRVQVSTDFISGFPAELAVRRHFEEINEALGGAGTMNVVIKADSREAFKEPVNLRAIRDLQIWLESRPEIGGTTSLVDYLMLINRGFNEGDPAHFDIPESRRMVTQLLFFGANDEVEGFVDSAYQTANILARAKAVDTEDVTALVQLVEARLEELPPNLEGRLTGSMVLLAGTLDEIAWGQATSLLSAFFIIFLILALLFTSARVGMIALAPNALPVLVYFGILGFSGITLNITTGLVACLVLGIAVDDTIHYLSHFNSAAKRLADEEKGAVHALQSVGRPITYTTIALCLGFLVLTTATMRGQAEFGALAAATLAIAWFVDVLFTPAIAVRMRIVTLWDVLALDLGERPQDAVRLFHGLSKTQARIAALMATVRTFEKGERVCRTGDVAQEMYVVVEGELAAFVEGEDGQRIQLNVSRRGDVVGEVGLFQGGRRTADVEAVSAGRLIQLDKDSLERLRRRYPRTGAQIYKNLSEIIAERLVLATERLR